MSYDIVCVESLLAGHMPFFVRFAKRTKACKTAGYSIHTLMLVLHVMLIPDL